LRQIALSLDEPAHDPAGEPFTLRRVMRERDPQKWRPVLRKIAL
jgi:hypothetical protein